MFRKRAGTVGVKAGVHVKTDLTALNTAIPPISRSTLNLSTYFIDHCLAVLCKCLDDFWAFWEIFFFSKDLEENMKC